MVSNELDTLKAETRLPIKITSPAPRDEWGQMIETDREALIYQLPQWTAAMIATGKFINVSRLYERADGKKWLLPMVRSKLPIPGLAMHAAMPDGWGIGGLLSNHPLSCDEVELVFNDLVRQPVLRMVIHPNPMRAPHWGVCNLPEVHPIPRYDHVLDLTGGFEKVWNDRFHSGTRTKVRKAEHSNLTVEWGSSDEFIRLYYRVYMEWTNRRARRRHIPGWFSRLRARQRDPMERFQAVARMLPDAVRVYVAWLGHKPVASTIFTYYRQHAYYWRGASDLEAATPVRANDLLQARMIEDACELGCRYFHLGESGGVASLERFKSGFGAEKVSYTSYSIERLPLTVVHNTFNNGVKYVEDLLLHLHPPRPF